VRERFEVLGERELDRGVVELRYRVEFRSTLKLDWSASAIEQTRAKYQIPDFARMLAGTRRVVFTWSTPLAEDVEDAAGR
jgi:hypothetical protein